MPTPRAKHFSCHDLRITGTRSVDRVPTKPRVPSKTWLAAIPVDACTPSSSASLFLQHSPREKTFLPSSPLLFAGCGASMDPSRLYGSLQVVLFVLATGIALSATFLSDRVVASNGPAGRSLLQAKTGCSVNFEFMNYTIMTSQCKGPNYPAPACCQSFKQFACPYAAEINDLTTDCATTMFSYINLYGKYPPGLFASLCKEGKEGLNCTGFVGNSIASENSGGRHVGQKLSLAAVIVPIVLVPLLF